MEKQPRACFLIPFPLIVPVAFLHLGSPLKEVTDAVPFMRRQIPKHWLFIWTCLEEIFETCLMITSIELHPLMLVSVIIFCIIITYPLSNHKNSFFFKGGVFASRCGSTHDRMKRTHKRFKRTLFIRTKTQSAVFIRTKT